MGRTDIIHGGPPATTAATSTKWSCDSAISWAVSLITVGQTVDLSRCAIRFVSDNPPPEGVEVELRIAWPYLLQNVCPLELVVRGTAKTNSERGTVLAMDRYEFRTCGERSFVSAATGTGRQQLLGLSRYTRISHTFLRSAREKDFSLRPANREPLRLLTRLAKGHPPKRGEVRGCCYTTRNENSVLVVSTSSFDSIKAGGVLMIFENDSGSADIEHLNLLSEKFGIHYNSVLRNQVDGNKFEMGKVPIKGSGPIFHDSHTAYMKEICTISVKAPATELLRDRGDILMATTKYGKGTVFATVDPWLYNEYTDGRKLPAEYDNYAAGKELVRWILQQIPRGHAARTMP